LGVGAFEQELGPAAGQPQPCRQSEGHNAKQGGVHGAGSPAEFLCHPQPLPGSTAEGSPYSTGGMYLALP